MTHLVAEHLVEVGEAAARQAKGAAAELVRVRTSYDSAGEVAHFFDFKTKAKQEPQSAVVTRLELAHALRDRLIDLGDEAYPYVRLTSETGSTLPVDD